MAEVYFTRAQLIDAAKVADLTKRNRRIAWEKLPEDVAYFPVVFNMVHNDVEMRVQIMCNYDGQTAFLDIPFETFDSLGRMEDLVKAKPINLHRRPLATV